MKKYITILFIAALLICLNTSCSQGVDKVLLPAVVVQSGGEKSGYIDDKGKFIIKPIYDFTYDFNDKGIAIVANGTSSYDVCNVSFINKKGKTVLGPYTTTIPTFKDGIAIVTDGTEFKLIGDTGKQVLSSKYPLAEYGENLVTFSTVIEKKTLYGYMDISGKIVIKPLYKYAWAFKNGRAEVQLNDDSYAVIDKSGKIIDKLNYYDSDKSSEGFAVYYDKAANLYGYKTLDGKIVLKAQYSDAEAFKDGYAVVQVKTGEYDTKYALIDTTGKYIIKPEFSGISQLGQDLYAVSNSEYASFDNDQYFPKAIFNNKGQKLTDYKFYNIQEFDGDYAVASDSTSTFFIDKKGTMVKALPHLKGIGTMKFIGDIIKAELDDGLVYLHKDGGIIWHKDESIPLGDSIKVKTIKYRPDYLTFIKYPELEGLKDKTVQDTVNKKLKKFFIGGYQNTVSPDNIDPDEGLDDITDGFTVTRNKDLLIINESGYDYPIGAAHGMPSNDYYYIDLNTGRFYNLKDLFKNGSNYTKKLTSIVQKQYDLNSRMDSITQNFGYLEDKPEVSEDSGFIINDDTLSIYYYPYEIACYASGFPQFDIPYGQLTDIIDTKGDFWNSFNKKLIIQKTMNVSSADSTTITSITKLIDKYEGQMVDAINTNNFNNVKECLLEGSGFYNSQKELVQNLYSRDIKEKLGKYEIYAVGDDLTDNNVLNKDFKVFVLEEIAVQHPGKSYTDNNYSWCYTVRFNDKTKTYNLSNIQKW